MSMIHSQCVSNALEGSLNRIDDINVSSIDTAPSVAQVRFNSDRTYDSIIGITATEIGDWLKFYANPSDYEIQVTNVVGGTLDVGSANSWLALSSNRTFGITTESGKNITFDVEIREAASIGNNVTLSVELDAQII